MRVLCLAAHPDDETLLVVATVAYPPRWSESDRHVGGTKAVSIIVWRRRRL
jgi:hypothetical protein